MTTKELKKLRAFTVNHLKVDISQNPKYWAEEILSEYRSHKKEKNILLDYINWDELSPWEKENIVQELGFNPDIKSKPKTKPETKT